MEEKKWAIRGLVGTCTLLNIQLFVQVTNKEPMNCSMRPRPKWRPHSSLRHYFPCGSSQSWQRVATFHIPCVSGGCILIHVALKASTNQINGANPIPSLCWKHTWVQTHHGRCTNSLPRHDRELRSHQKKARHNQVICRCLLQVILVDSGDQTSVGVLSESLENTGASVVSHRLSRPLSESGVRYGRPAAPPVADVVDPNEPCMIENCGL